MSSPATTTIEIGWVSGQGVALDGVIEYDGDESSGLQVHNFGYSGTWVQGWLTGTANGWALSQALVNPDLYIIEFGGNERIVGTGNRTSAQFQTELTTYIAHLRTSGITCPIVINAFADFSGYVGSTFVEPWANYVAAMRAVASADPTVAAPIEQTNVMPSSAAANTYGLYSSDKLHPTEIGNRLIAGHIANVLLGEVQPTARFNTSQNESGTSATLNYKYNTVAPPYGIRLTETDTLLEKVGDGVTTYPYLHYINKGHDLGDRSLSWLEESTRIKLENYNSVIAKRFTDAEVITELWNNKNAWNGTSATTASNKVYNVVGGGLGQAAAYPVAAGLAPGVGRQLHRTTLVSTGAASARNAFFGVNGDAVNGTGTKYIGLGIGTNGNVNIASGAGITLGEVRSYGLNAGIVPAGTYLCTIAIDETSVSLSMQTLGSVTQTLALVVLPRTALNATSSGAVNNVWLNTTGNSTTDLAFGPWIKVSDLVPPPLSQQTAAGTNLFGVNNPIIMGRIDATGIRHVAAIPGNYDPRVPLPVVLFLHESGGHAMKPWSQVAWANVLQALMAGGYGLLASDNGTSVTGGGNDDKWGNQAGQDDYAAAVEWYRTKFASGDICLYGPSMGGIFVQNILAKRQIGGIAAVAAVSPSAELILSAGDVTYGPGIRSAYGATDVLDMVEKSRGYNHVLHPALLLRGVPQRFYSGGSDSIAPPLYGVAPLLSRLTGFVPEVTEIVVPGVNHLDASLYQGSNVVTFFNTYVMRAPSILDQQREFRVLPISGITAFTAEIGYNYRIDATAATVAVTLPSASIDGGQINLEHTGTANTVTYIRGGTDTIEGLTTALTLQPGEKVSLMYRAADQKWYLERSLWSATAGTMVRRDNAGRIQNADPVTALDSTNKGYVDANFVNSFTISDINTNTAAVADTWYRGSATLLVTLPASPANGDVIRVENTATTVGTIVSYQRGGTTTVEGVTAAVPLMPQERHTLTYRASNTMWYVERAGITAQDNPATQVLPAAATYVSPQTKLPAGSLAVGDSWRFTVAMTNSATSFPTITARAGAAGTTADASVAGPTFAAGSGANGHGTMEITFTVRTLGAAGVLVIGYRYLGTAVFSSTQATALNTTLAINTTVDQYIGVAAQASVASAITVQNVMVERIRKA